MVSKLKIYNIKGKAIGAIISYIAYRIFMWYCEQAMMPRTYNTWIGIIKLLTIIVLWGTNIYADATSIMNKNYRLATGRSYPHDHAKFKWDFFSLKKFFTTNDPYKMDLKSLPTKDWHTVSGCILGRVKDPTSRDYHLIYKPSKADGNLLCTGLPGSGKTTRIASTSHLSFNRGKGKNKGGCGVFSISIKGDLHEMVKDKRTNLKLFTPDKEDGSCHFDPLEGVKEMDASEKRVFFEALSISVIPDEAGDNASYFVEGARNLFVGISIQMLSQRPDATIIDIVNFILKNDVFSVIKNITEQGIDDAKIYVASFMGNNEKNVSSIYQHLVKCTRPLTSGALSTLLNRKGTLIHPEDLLTHDVMIDIPVQKMEVYAPILRIVITTFLNYFLSRDDVATGKDISPILFLLDEATNINLPFETLQKSMSLLRSKKISIFLLNQSIQQWYGLYGQSKAKQIFDLCAYMICYDAQDPDSRKFWQELIGKRKMLQVSNSTSKSYNNESQGQSVSVTDEEIIAAADLGDLKSKMLKEGLQIKEDATYALIYSKGKYCLAETIPYWE